MQRRRRVAENGGVPTLVTNTSDVQLGVGKIVISPGGSVVLSGELMDHAAVKRWMRQGILTKGTHNAMIRRCVSNRPLRLVHFVHTMFGGGAERMTLEIHKALKKYEVEQWMFCFYVGEPELNTMLSVEAREIFDFYYEQRVSVATEYVHQFITDTISEYDPDIVLYANLPVIPEIIYAIPQRPPVIQIHHSELSDTLACYRSGMVDAVIACSDAIAKNRVKDLGIPQEQMYVIQNRIDPERVTGGTSLRKDLGISRSEYVLGMVGNLNPLKRPSFALQAAVKAGRELGKVPHIVYAGKPDTAEELKKQAEDYGCADKVHILGYRNDVENVYATVDVALNCSVSEGMPTSLVEAMFNKLPVIATAVGGNPELVLHGETGYLVGIHDVDGMAECIVKLADSDMRREMSKAAYSRAKSEFHISVTASRYWDVFQDFVITPAEPRCSVVIPVWNGAETIGRALESLQLQTMPDFECIVVDDGSDDDTRAIVAGIVESDGRFRLLHQPHAGIVPALNMGIGAARTGLIVRLDADDAALPNRLELQVSFMESHPDTHVLGGQMICVDKHGNFIRRTEYPCSHEEIREQLLHTNPMGHPATCYRKAAAEEVGGYRGTGQAEDLMFWMDLMVAGKQFANLPEAVTKFTMTHEGDTNYAKWVHEHIPEAQQDYKLRMRRMELGEELEEVAAIE